MNHAVCLGGKMVQVDKGYWRINKNSTKMYECLRENACEGGYNEDSKYPVN
jgi:hypothetical protein